MSEQLLQQLDNRVNQALELIGLLRLQLEESEEKNAALEADIISLKSRQHAWEQGLSSLLRKFEGTDLAASFGAVKTDFARERELETI